MSVRYDEAMSFPLEATSARSGSRDARAFLFIANPNNPTGTLLRREDLRRILDAAPRTLVLVDEAYFDFAGLTVLPWIRRDSQSGRGPHVFKSGGPRGAAPGRLFAQRRCWRPCAGRLRPIP